MLFSLSAQDKQVEINMWSSIMDPFSSGKIVFSVNVWFGQQLLLRKAVSTKVHVLDFALVYIQIKQFV